MRKHSKLLHRILLGTSDANVRFSEVCELLWELGFKERIQGSHHIFAKEGVVEILNLQPKGANAKVYQVKQVRNVIIKYKMRV
ncbi:MAG: type II toxin-antitoxin system HicA family toxin [Dehalococcoidia bacterium]|nr:type II toxin-antitoxin system HicA family toxin [Dehalococcoidia bacterium]